VDKITTEVAAVYPQQVDAENIHSKWIQQLSAVVDATSVDEVKQQWWPPHECPQFWEQHHQYTTVLIGCGSCQSWSDAMAQLHENTWDMCIRHLCTCKRKINKHMYKNIHAYV